MKKLRALGATIILLVVLFVPQKYAFAGCAETEIAVNGSYQPPVLDNRAIQHLRMLWNHYAPMQDCYQTWDEYHIYSPKPAPREAAKPKVTPKTKTQDAGNLADTAKVDPVWADDTRKRIAGKKDDTVEVAEMETNAPYGDPNCALIRPAANRGEIDKDWVTVTNRCSYPVGILVCYYDVGQERDCLPGGTGSWGLINLGPGATTTSVATSKRMPWMVKGTVCNMTPREHNRMLCVLPKSYNR